MSYRMRIVRVSRTGRLRSYVGRVMLGSMRRRIAASGMPKMAIIAHDTIGDAVVLTGRYEADLLHAITHQIVPAALPAHRDLTAVDVGANIGNHALAFAPIFARVLAFEPNPAAVHLLQANILLNWCSNITVYPVGLGEHKQSGAFRTVSGNLGASRFVAPTDQGASGLLTLEIVNGDAFILERLGPSERVGLVKIDVEGLETSVVAGMSALLARDSPLVLFEALDRVAGEKTMTALREAGYGHFFSIEPNRVVARSEILRAVMRWVAGADLYMQRVESLEDRDYGLILACTVDDWLRRMQPNALV